MRDVEKLLELASRFETISPDETSEALDIEFHQAIGNAPEMDPWAGFGAFSISLTTAMGLLPDEGTFPQITKVGPNSWHVHIGFGNRAVGVTGKGQSAPLAYCAAVARYFAGEEPNDS